MNRIFTGILAALALSSPFALASELDPVPAKAPSVVLVKTDDQNAVLKAYAVDVTDPRTLLASEEARAAVVTAQATPENEIALKLVKGLSELDREGSTQAWYFNGFWGWNFGWIYNPGWNFTYYNWCNPWAYRGFRWNFFW